MARLGFALSRGLPPSDIVDCVKLAEALGYESAWAAEGHGGDQFAILTACAMVTERILLGTSISSVFVRSVPTIAMAAATVDHLSNQRQAFDAMRSSVAFYCGFFPRYNRLMAESGSPRRHRPLTPPARRAATKLRR
jgi:alkanesulfonate monooxygenase SsuD/methylene tetrahydromethanopterin reductase-like flavin-dependent oxidoreductase (luciferase family)